MGKTRKIINIPLAQDFIRRVGGKDAVKVIKIYEKKGRYVTDEELAEKMKLKVTEVRTILNRLHYRGIACYQKTKNNRTGWYSYTWGIKSKRIAELLLEEMMEKMEKLEARQEIQSSYGLFSCNGNCEVIPFEVAAEYGFKCPECGKAMQVVDNEKAVKETGREIQKLKQGIEEIKKIL